MEFFGILWTEVIMRPMINSLVLLYDLLWNNFGLSIIFFTVLVRIVLIPLTVKQTRQMRTMSQLQPKMKAIQEKYKKDPAARQKASQETMRLYRQAGVNPVGCLGPMVLQIPIWIGLYRAIFRTVPVTPEGMANLSNLLYSWNPSAGIIPLNSQFVGMDLVNAVQFAPAPINFVLPVLVGASMWVQQKMMTVPSADPRQQQTNQMMLWMLPIMFGVFTWTFPAGLAVYILFSNLIGIGITYFITGPSALFGNRAGEAQPAVAAVSLSDADAPKETSDATSAVLGENGGRGDRHRSRSPQRKPRRRRNRRR